MFGTLALWLLLCVPMFVGCMCCGTPTCAECVAVDWRLELTGVGTNTLCDGYNGTWDFALAPVFEGSDNCSDSVETGVESGFICLGFQADPFVGWSLLLAAVACAGVLSEPQALYNLNMDEGDCDLDEYTMSFTTSTFGSGPGTCTALPLTVTINAI